MYKDFGQITERMYPPQRHKYRTPKSQAKYIEAPFKFIGLLILIGLIINLFQ